MDRVVIITHSVEQRVSLCVIRDHAESFLGITILIHHAVSKALLSESDLSS